MNRKIRCYSDLILLPTFEERFEYLMLSGRIGASTFGFERYLNQEFYRSKEWRNARDFVIVRDGCCDLADPDHPIRGHVVIHHMNPISIDDIEGHSSILTDPEFLITTIMRTHNAIHYGDKSLLPKAPIVRRPNDTCPWH